jgi:hypothetical protein
MLPHPTAQAAIAEAEKRALEHAGRLERFAFARRESGSGHYG